ncbi:MAG: hypothetical protein DRO11_05475, partial [Methanobacteriota archaeon]
EVHGSHQQHHRDYLPSGVWMIADHYVIAIVNNHLTFWAIWHCPLLVLPHDQWSVAFSVFQIPDTNAEGVAVITHTLVGGHTLINITA